MSNNPLIESALLEVLGECFQLRTGTTSSSSSATSVLLPVTHAQLTASRSFLSLLDVLFLNAALPHDLQNRWRLLFNTAVHGESFSKLVGGITNQGPTLVIVKGKKLYQRCLTYITGTGTKTVYTFIQFCGSRRFLTGSGSDFWERPDPDLNVFSAKFLMEMFLAEISSKMYIH
jgi:hypothetical protein